MKKKKIKNPLVVPVNITEEQLKFIKRIGNQNKSLGARMCIELAIKEKLKRPKEEIKTVEQ